jgi:hypothetical protein
MSVARLVSVPVLAIATSAAAQTSVSPEHKVSWSENAGWANWADAGLPPGSEGMTLHGTYLAGFVWCENIGWVNLGNGSPVQSCDGAPCYGNGDGADWGVNVDAATGLLSGYAWGENVGWINFGGGAAAGVPARVDVNARRLRGYAWSENTGWINLDDAAEFVGLTGICGSADFDGDGDTGTDADIEAFFRVLGGGVC